MNNTNFILDFFLPKQFKGADYWTKTRVVLINILLPLSIISCCFLTISEWESFLSFKKTPLSNTLTVGYVVSITAIYFFFLRDKNINRFWITYVIVSILYFSIAYYFNLKNSSTTLWFFSFVILSFCFSHLKYGITSFLTFYTILTLISITKHNSLNEEFYSKTLLFIFAVCFIIYSAILIISNFTKKEIVSLYSKQKKELEENNTALSHSLYLQEKLYTELKEKEKESCKNSKELLAIINNTNDLIWVVDNDFKVTIYNKAFKATVRKSFNIEKDDFEIDEVFTQNKESKAFKLWAARHQEVIDRQTNLTFYDEYPAKNGKAYFITEIYPIKDKGVVVSSTAFSKNISTIRNIKEEKEELLQRNSSIIESIGEIVYEYNLKTDTFIWNEATYDVLGYTHQEIGKTYKEFTDKIHQNDIIAFEREVEIAKKSGENFTIDIQFQSKSGYLWMQNRGNIIYDNKGVPSRVFGVLSDISNKKNQDTRRLKAVVQGVDLERKRIAGEIHDSLGQTLIAASLTLNSLSAVAKEHLSEEEYKKHQSVEKMINDAIQEGRELSHRLMPQSLADYGIVPAISTLVNKFNNTKKLHAEFHTNLGDEQRFHPDIEVNLYRVTQEAFNNIFKHSQAKKVTLQLLHYENQLTYTIEDDGTGFTPDENQEKNGLGLQNIKNRIRAIGGTIQYDSHKDYGTLITIEVDLQQALFKD